MISGAPVLKVRVAGRMTPTDFLVPSARVSQGEAVAHALAVKVDIGFGGDGNVVKVGGGHGAA